MSGLPGRIISIGSDQCFIPEPLPPKLEIPASIHNLHGDCMHVLGQVQASARLLPNPSLLTYSSLQMEAVASSTMEGTVASPEELALLQAGLKVERHEALEVETYRQALQMGIAMLPDRRISLEMMLALHAKQMSGIERAKSPGRLKIRQNYIVLADYGEDGTNLFTPCPPSMTVDLLSEWENYLNLEPKEPKLIQVALAHYQFEVIHPFSDGNGRMGRLIIILQMIQLGLLDGPWVYPSVYFERTRDRYISHLHRVTAYGEWLQWIEYFLTGLRHQAKAALSLMSTILALEESLEQLVSDGRSAESTRKVLKQFFKTPCVTIQQVTQKTGLSYKTVRNAIFRLEDEQVLETLGEGKRNRLYLCRPIWNAIFYSEERVKGQASMDV